MDETTKLDVEEYADVTTVGAGLGLRCTVALSLSLLERVDAHTALSPLSHLRDVLAATTSDPALATFRAVVLRGERARSMRADLAAMREFATRCKAGIGGVGPTGTVLACQLRGTTAPIMMICQLGFGIVRPGRNPDLLLTTVEGASFYVESIAARSGA
jgi:hypothetical protein